MNIHKNARLTVVRRHEMVRDMIEHQMTPAAASAVRFLLFVRLLLPVGA